MAFIREYPPPPTPGSNWDLMLDTQAYIHSKLDALIQFTTIVNYQVKWSSEIVIIYFSAIFVTLFFQLSQALETVLTLSCYDVTTS